jgi:hypothetical protein
MLNLNNTILQSSKGKADVNFTISKWTKVDPPDLYNLEEKTWAPWLRKPLKNFETITKIFPDGQRKIINSKGEVVAMISTNRINWDGNLTSLPTWDSVAGGSIELSDFSTTYLDYGNTLDIMSVSVSPKMQGKGLATILLNEVITMAEVFEVDHLICSFRPCGFGSYKSNEKNLPVNFSEYCQITAVNGLPLDPWLRIATRYGMIPLRIEENAIKVEVSKDKFEEYKNKYNKNNWHKNEKGEWECGEAGKWKVSGDKAIYTEPNLWGEIPIR